MNIEFTTHAWKEFNYWLDMDIDTVNKIKELIKAIKQHLFKEIIFYLLLGQYLD